MTAPIDQFAQWLDLARLERREVARLTEQAPGLTLADAYAVQAAGIALREQAGERVVAWKMGLTSEGKRRQMNLDAAVYGVLTDRMAVLAGQQMSLATAIHPKVEPEIVFRLCAPLRAGMTRQQALACVDGVAAGLEVLDSRYVGFKYFSLPDVVADNSSSFRFAIGPFAAIDALDVSDVAMTMQVDGQVVAEGRSREISGDPVLSLVQLADLAALYGHVVPAGTIVLSGAATPAFALAGPCHVVLQVAGLTPVQLAVVP